MNGLGSFIIQILQTTQAPWEGQQLPFDELIPIIAFPVILGFILVTFFSMYYLGEAKATSRFGLSSKAITAAKHTSLNFLIVAFGALFFTFLLWQFYFPIPYWGDQTIIATAFGLLLGISFGFMTFYTLYRRQ